MGAIYPHDPSAPEPAKPQHPERRAGQRWRWDGDGKDYLLSRPEVMGTEKVWWCAARGENEGFFREPVFERGELTLIADAPAPEATVPLIDAHVEHLVGVEMAHRREIATLQAMVVELRGRLGEAERPRFERIDPSFRSDLYGLLDQADKRQWFNFIGRLADVAKEAMRKLRDDLNVPKSAPSPPDSPVAALPCGCISHPWGGSCPKPAAPAPASTAYSAHVVQAENARAHAEESATPDSPATSAGLASCRRTLGTCPTTLACFDARRCLQGAAPPVSTVDSRVAALEARVAALETWRGALKDVPDGIQHEYVNDGKKRCEVCGVRQYAECHAVPGAAK